MIIATGGFADSPEMMKKYTRFPNTDGIAQTGKNGVGIQMALSAGGGKEGLEVQQSYRPGPRAVSTTNHVSATAKQPHLWLTRTVNVSATKPLWATGPSPVMLLKESAVRCGLSMTTRTLTL